MSDEICWIDVAEDGSSAALEEAYGQLRRNDGTVHNLYRAFSQFPAPVVSADQFYRDVMHTEDAPLAPWLAELLSVDVAIRNGCTYAETHHGANFLHLHPDREVADEMYAALRQGDTSNAVFDDRLQALLDFSRKLTAEPAGMAKDDVEALRQRGLNDAEISQSVQVIASFAYWTRLINALGIKIGNEKIGKYD